VPDYDAAQGYELAGFAWFQGWNDMVDSSTYLNRDKPGGYDAYSTVMAHFIRDVRRDLSAPQMPFVIGVMGVGGAQAGPDVVAFREAMIAPARLPEFQGNVAAVPTAPFWSEELGAIDDKHAKVRQMAYYLDSRHKDHANADGAMTPVQKRAYLAAYEADLITPAEVALWKRGASNGSGGCWCTTSSMARAGAAATPALPFVSIATAIRTSRVSGSGPGGVARAARKANTASQRREEVNDAWASLLVTHCTISSAASITARSSLVISRSSRSF
jgi:alpha-galactosidase